MSGKPPLIPEFIISFKDITWKHMKEFVATALLEEVVILEEVIINLYGIGKSLEKLSTNSTETWKCDNDGELWRSVKSLPLA